MNELLTPPRTIMQVFKALPEGPLAEVIENKLYMASSFPFSTGNLNSNFQRVESVCEEK